MATRERAIPLQLQTKGKIQNWRYVNWVNLDEVPPHIVEVDNSDAVSHLVGSQFTDSQNHPSWRSRSRDRFRGDLGGPFFTQKKYFDGSLAAIDFSGNNMDFSDPHSYRDGNFQVAHYWGTMLPCNPRLIQFPPAMSSSFDNLDELGTKAISQCSPSSPVADLSTFLGELVKEGLPSMIGKLLHGWRTKNLAEVRKDIGSEYLNWEFGWKPIISDLKKLSSTIVHGDQIWAQYERDAGKLVRRRFEFPVVRSASIEVLPDTHPYLLGPDDSALYNWGKSPIGHCLCEHTLTQRRWFSGAFTYYLPSDRSSVAAYVIKAKKLLGLTLTPEVVWNLMPWSWALDWFGSTGDIISNWSNWMIDGQVLQYGYMMEHSISKYTYTWVGDTYYRASIAPPTVSTVVETKIRRQATPYGFGLSWNGFTPRQIAITTALGMSRGK
jgi:hypothetical protein